MEESNAYANAATASHQNHTEKRQVVPKFVTPSKSSSPVVKSVEIVLPGEPPANIQLQNSVSVKTLNANYNTIKQNLQSAFYQLSEKEASLKNDEEQLVRHREKTWLLEERIRLMTEKLCCLKRCLERKGRKQEDIYKELDGVKWKISECGQFADKLKHKYSTMRSKILQRQEGVKISDSQGEQTRCSHKESLQQDINRLTHCKLQLQNGDKDMHAIRNGSKMGELEQRKKALEEAIDARSKHSVQLLLEIEEKTDRIQRIKKSLHVKKEQHQDMLRERKNHYAYLAETELRLQRSLDYLRSKIDYGTYVPAPWPKRGTTRFQY